MRWLFLFVLLVNVAYVSWELSQSKMEPVMPSASTNAPTIELLSEIGQATKNPTQPVESVEVSQKPSTSGVVKQAEPAKQQTPVTPPVEVASDIDRCYTLGPFRELDNLREFTRAIKNYVVTASFRSREEQEQSLFWVYLEPAGGLEAARALGKRLESANIKDYYVINSGPQEKGVSLGHFKEKDRAHAHANRIKQLGFKPVVEPVFRTYTIYWLDYQVPAGKLIPRKVFAKYLAKNINRLDRSCS